MHFKLPTVGAGLCLAGSWPLSSLAERADPIDLTAAMRSGIMPLVVGGTEVPVGERTYVTGIRMTIDGADFCGGSLITPLHVLSAAHCAVGKPKFVSVGTHFIKGTKDGVQVAVKNVTVHPVYKAPSNDFMILELEKPVTTYKPVGLACSDPAVGATMTVAGWGSTSSGGQQSEVLLQVDLQVVDQATCRQKLKTIDETMLCAGGLKNEDSCQGDSGGPLTAKVDDKDVQVGVVSWGEGCGKEGFPGVYSRIANARKWIDSVIKPSAQSIRWVKLQS